MGDMVSIGIPTTMTIIMVEKITNSTNTPSFFFALLLCVVIAVPSALLNLLLVAFSSMLIQISLILSPLSFFVAFIGSFATMNCPVALFSLIMAVLGIKYATAVWHKVPFATANLQIALA